VARKSSPESKVASKNNPRENTKNICSIFYTFPCHAKRSCKIVSVYTHNFITYIAVYLHVTW
jgi:hypothetical protein